MIPVNFNVLTYNVFAFPKIIENVAQNERLSKIVDKISTVRDLDVVSLNELWDNSEREMVVDKMRAIGFKYTSGVIPRHPIALMNGGVQIFSKHKITNTEYITYSKCTSEDCLSSKGAIYARILKKTGEGCFPFNVIGTHLNVGSVDNKKQRKVQFSQIKELKKFIDRRKSVLNNKDEPFLITGDINVDKKEGPEDFNEMLKILESEDFTDIPFSKRAKNTVRRSGAIDSEYTKLLDYLLWHNVKGVKGEVENIYESFKLTDPIINTRYCPGELGRGFFKSKCDINVNRELYDLSDHDPILGKFVVPFVRNSCGKVSQNKTDILSHASIYVLQVLPALLLALIIFYAWRKRGKNLVCKLK